MKKFILLFLILFQFNYGYEKTIIKYPNIYGMHDDSYGFQLLKLALSKVDDEYEVVINSRGAMTELRAFQELIKNNISVYDAGFSTKHLDEFDPVYIPIDKGLLGWRIFVINKKNQQQFEKIKELSDLQTKIAGQGTGWIDVDIIRNSGITVITSSEIKLLFKMLNKNRFDFFPLGINEVENLCNFFAKNYQNLMIEESIVYVYPFARVYYVKKGNTELKNAIKKGLEKAYEDGSFQKLFEQNFFSKVLKNLSLEKRNIIRVDNPFLADEFKKIDPKWWYQID